MLIVTKDKLLDKPYTRTPCITVETFISIRRPSAIEPNRYTGQSI